MRPSEMAGFLGSPMLILLVWLIAGLFTMFSAMVNAEVGAMFPETGGQYIYMRHMYGDFWSYLFGWASFAVINTAGTAGISFIASQYIEYFFKLPRFSPAIEHSFVLHIPLIGDLLPLENFGVKSLTIIILCVLTFISYRSTKAGGSLQNFFTSVKVAAIVLLVGGLFFSGKGSFQNFISSDASLKPVGFLAMTAAIVAACNGALQAYDGWYMALNVAGEIKDPQKNITRSLFIGLFVCMIVYMLVTAAIIYMMPVGAMARSELVASDAASIAFGTIGGGIIAALISINVMGTTNSNVLAPPRITFAMAQEKRFFAWTGKIHPKFNTPGNAMLLHLFWMIPLVLSGSFFILADMYIFVVFIFNLMLVAGIYILRKKMPDAPRPYKVWGYPWMPALVIVFNLIYLVITVRTDIHNYVSGKTHVINSVFGIILCLIGIPFYFYFKKKYGSSVEKTSNVSQ
jgi:APA family basic amino acid/polyamine antiporter